MNTQRDNFEIDPGDAFEFAVSQAVDGVLGDADRRTLGDRLTTSDAGRLADDHARVNALLRTYSAVPDVDFDAVAAAFTGTLAAEDAYAPAPLSMWPVWRGRLAMAAAVALVAVASWPFLPHRGTPPIVSTGEAIVQGPVVTAPAGAPQASVAIGPSDVLVRRGLAMGLSPDDATAAKPKVVISSADVPNDLRPY